MKTNKEVIDVLQEYFLKQDQVTICRALASALIDFNRIFLMSQLNEEEKEVLKTRIVMNVDMLQRFVLDPSERDKPFTLYNLVDNVYKSDP